MFGPPRLFYLNFQVPHRIEKTPPYLNRPKLLRGNDLGFSFCPANVSPYVATTYDDTL